MEQRACTGFCVAHGLQLEPKTNRKVKCKVLLRVYTISDKYYYK